MRGVKVFIDRVDVKEMVELVPVLNQENSLVATIVNVDEFLLCASNDTAMAWAKALIASRFNGEVSFETIK